MEPNTHSLNASELLGRAPISEAQLHVTPYLRNKVVLITGAGGSIGSELTLQVAKQQPGKLLLLGHGENSIFAIDQQLREQFPHLAVELLIADIQDRSLLDSIFRRYKPHSVFHAAAHKHVLLMEKNGAAAVRNNIWGTKILAETSITHRVKKFICISTDKAVHPANIMGATKRVSEMIIQQLAIRASTSFSIVRFGNVLESRGSVIPIFKKQIADGGPVTVTHPDMLRYFMSIPEAVHLVLQAGSLCKGGEIFILDMGEPIRIVDVARAVIRMQGLQPDVDIPIKFIGIRDGEKLTESLVYEEETLQPSKHPRISMILPKPLNEDILMANLKQLETLNLNEAANIKELLLCLISNSCMDLLQPTGNDDA